MKGFANMLICGLCALASTACEVEFDFKDLDADPLFVIDGTITDDRAGNSNLQMYLYAVPSAAGERDFPEEARCTLKVYRNGELMGTRSDITIQSFYGLIADNYPVEPGDEILVTAESGGFPTASATTVIPQSPPEVEVLSCRLEGDNLRIRFSLEDNAGTDDAYAFCFRTATYDTASVPEDGVTGYSIPLGYDIPDGFPVLDAGPFDVCWDDGVTYYGIHDSSFNGMRKEFEVIAPFETAPGNAVPWFRLEAQRISPERLRYETACADKTSNILGFIGLAPVTFAYTNVSGGSGCFSSANVAFSDWTEIQGR